MHDENLHEPKSGKIFSQMYLGDTYTDGSEEELDRRWTRMDADGLQRLGRHFGDEVPSELPVGLGPARRLRFLSASIRG